MDKLTYGLVITVVGMGGTLLGLYVIVVAIQLLKHIFPYRKEEEEETSRGGATCSA